MGYHIRDGAGRYDGYIGDAAFHTPTPSPLPARSHEDTPPSEDLAAVYDHFQSHQPLLTHTEHSVWVNDAEVVIHVTEPADGRAPNGTVVFLHGWGLGPKSYQDTMDAMAKHGYRIITPGMPGFGGSAFLPHNPPRQQIVGDTAEHLHAALHEFNEPGPWTLAGHSFGGGVATSLAALHPQSVSSLLLLSPIGGDTGAGSWMRALASLGGEIHHSSTERVRDALPVFFRGLGRTVSTGIAAKSTDLRGALAVCSRTMPVTMVTADDDKVTPVGHLQQVPGIRHVSVPGSHGWLLSGEGLDHAAHILDTHTAPVR